MNDFTANMSLRALRIRAALASWRAVAAATCQGATTYLLPLAAAAADEAQPAALVPEAHVLPSKVLLLDAVKAGERFVVVGERGRILYSDDDGQTWKVAATPVLTTLTSVAFSDVRNGAVVGHRGTILITEDGGATWQAAQVDAKDQNALLAVWMNGKAGIAVGAFGTYLETRDAGRTWAQRQILGSDFDRHLNAIIAGKEGAMLIAGESGTVAISADGGHTWSAQKSLYQGTFFGGLGLADGSMLVFGMRGTVLRSNNNGMSWTKVELDHYHGAVQNGAALPDGSVALVGAEGLVASSRDQGATFTLTQMKDRRHIGGVVFGPGGRLLITGEGGVRWTDFAPPK